MISYFRSVWQGIYTVLLGMKITLIHLFSKNVTVQYPNVHPTEKAGPDKMPPNARNRLYVDMEECNGCMGCVRACPVNCITVETVKVVPGDTAPPLRSGAKRGLWVTNYEIDFAKCCFCGLCTEACPTNAIVMTTEFEYSAYDRNDLIYNFVRMQNTMTPEKIKEVKEKYEKFQQEKKKAEAEKKASAQEKQDSEEAK